MSVFEGGECAVCGLRCGNTDFARLADGALLCGECRLLCSAFLTGLRNMTLAQVSEHIAYMQSRSELYSGEFSVASNTKRHIINGKYGVILDGDAGLFLIRSPETDMRVYMEPFRFSEVLGCEPYEHMECGSGGKKSCTELGLRLRLDNPWYSEILVPFASGQGGALAPADEFYARRAARSCMELLTGG